MFIFIDHEMKRLKIFFLKTNSIAVATIRGVIGVVYPPPLESWG